MSRIAIAGSFLCLFALTFGSVAGTDGPLEKRSTADHTKFEELHGPFAKGQDVTRACLKCHTEAGQQFMKNIHWTWNYENKKTGQLLGKKHLVNTFCTNARGNEVMQSVSKYK